MRAQAVAVVLALLLADTPGGCASTGGGQDEGPPSCFMKVSRAPALYRRTGANDVIRGAIAVRCNPTPRRHLLTVWLSQEFPAGSDVWLPRGEAKRSDRLPDGHGFDVSVTFPGCISGRWRVQGRAQGASVDGTLWGPSDLPPGLSPAADIRCQGPGG